jgi:hypothetical protein
MAYVRTGSGKHIDTGSPDPDLPVPSDPYSPEPEDARRIGRHYRHVEFLEDQRVAEQTGLSPFMVKRMRINQKIARILQNRKSDLPEDVIEAILMAEDITPASELILDGIEPDIQRPPTPRRGRPRRPGTPPRPN